MVRCVVLGVALFLTLVGLASAELMSRPGSEPLISGAKRGAPLVRVQGEACTEACRREHSACLIRDKGSPNCNVRLQQCLQACLAGKRH